MKTNFCFEKDIVLIENYDKALSDNFKGWIIHHRLELEDSSGNERPKQCYLSSDELIALDMYYFRPPEELIFMRRNEHLSLHNKYTKSGNKNTLGMKREPATEETKKKISEKLKGHTGVKSNLGRKFSKEWKRKISEARKGSTLSEETKRKISETKNGTKKNMTWKVIDGKRVWIKKE